MKRLPVLTLFLILGVSIICQGAQAAAPNKNGKISAKNLRTSAASTNLWSILPQATEFPDYRHQPQVQAQITWFTQHQKFLHNVVSQASPYLFYIYQEVEKRQLPGELVLLPMIESAYDPFAHSWVGAAGLWQFMPKTAHVVGIKQNWWYDGRRDVTTSTKAALAYLNSLHQLFNGDWLLAIAAYNAGSGTVQRAIAKNKAEGKSTEFWDLPLPQETKLYVPRLLALASIIKYPKQYPMAVPKVKAKPYFVEVDIGQQIDLAHAAKMADISLNELYQLNPGYSRWTTDPDGPHKLLLPVHKADQFAVNMATQGNIQVKINHIKPSNSAPSIRLAANKPRRQAVTKSRTNKNAQIAKAALTPSDPSAPTLINTLQYKVTAGDTLHLIAQQFSTTPRLIQQANSLSGVMIRPGQVLFIPQKVVA